MTQWPGSLTRTVRLIHDRWRELQSAAHLGWSWQRCTDELDDIEIRSSLLGLSSVHPFGPTSDGKKEHRLGPGCATASRWKAALRVRCDDICASAHCLISDGDSCTFSCRLHGWVIGFPIFLGPCGSSFIVYSRPQALFLISHCPLIYTERSQAVILFLWLQISILFCLPQVVCIVL